jgi:hypothetical protein
LLDIFGFWLIIPAYLKNQEGAGHVGNNSAKKQAQAKAGAGVQKAHEHRQRQGSDQPAQGQGKKTSRCITARPGIIHAVRIPKKRANTEKYGIYICDERKKTVGRRSFSFL